MSEAKKNQKSCILTFDQSLLQKASEIVYAKDFSIILRLGGFHLLMYFMSAVGFIMSGSGLEDLSKIYATVTVGHMIGGHAYSRVFRSHFLTRWDLTILLLDTCRNVDRKALTILHTDADFKIIYLGEIVEKEELNTLLLNCSNMYQKRFEMKK